MRFGSVKEILDFAISGEEESYKFYTELAAKVEAEDISEMLQSFANEELGHKEKLKRIKSGDIPMRADRTAPDLKIADYLVDVESKPDLNYQEALILAMQKEKAAFRLYTDLAGAVGDEKLRAAFLALAAEEAKHKLRFEVEYDDEILKEN